MVNFGKLVLVYQLLPLDASPMARAFGVKPLGIPNNKAWGGSRLGDGWFTKGSGGGVWARGASSSSHPSGPRAVRPQRGEPRRMKGRRSLKRGRRTADAVRGGVRYEDATVQNEKRLSLQRAGGRAPRVGDLPRSRGRIKMVGTHCASICLHEPFPFTIPRRHDSRHRSLTR